MAVSIDFTDRHEQHPESVKEYALEKVGRLARFFNRLNRIEIILGREHDEHTAEIIVTAPPNLRFVGHAANGSVLASIDKVVERLERQVVKAKERLRDHHRGGPTQ